MGLVGLRFAPMKRKLGVRTAIAAVLEEGPVICSVVVAAGSMIMIGIRSTTIGRSETPLWPTSAARLSKSDPAPG
jgi:hypothetical protein